MIGKVCIESYWRSVIEEVSLRFGNLNSVSEAFAKKTPLSETQKPDLAPNGNLIHDRIR